MYGLSLVAAAAAFTVSAYGQAVISTHSGLVHFFEGAVTVAGQPLQARFGEFTAIPEGGELRTAQGRAEILLTPGVFLRVGENSSIRMVSSSLADTKVEMLTGSAIVESAENTPGTSVTLLYKNWTVHQAGEGNYRLDCDPARVIVRGGTVTVAAAGEAPVTVERGDDLPLQSVLAPEASSIADVPDSLNDWSQGRAQSISADNAIAADIQDPATVTAAYAPADAFTYFPLLGYPSMASSVGTYGGVAPYNSGLYGTVAYQPGFNSLYLPGYTYRPLLLGVHPAGLGLGHTLYRPIGVGTGVGLTGPRIPITRPIAGPPMARPPVARPAPVVIHR
jgi:hypothetical protein